MDARWQDPEYLMIVAPLPAYQVDEFWPILEPYFEEFERLSHGEAVASELRTQVREMTRQCWVAHDQEIKAVALTEVMRGGVWLDFCAGEGRDAWAKALVEKIKAFADEYEKPIKIFGRPGWANWLKQEFGMKETYRLMEATHA